MKKIRTAKLLAFVCVFFRLEILEAYIDVTYDTSSSYDSGWEIGVSVLYWKPCQSYCPKSYSLENYISGSSNTQLSSNFFGDLDPDYQLGFRIYFMKESSGCFSSYSVSWDHICFESECLRIGRGDQTENNFFANNPITSKILFDRINLRARSNYVSDTCIKLDGFFGLSLMRLDQPKSSVFKFDFDGTLLLGRYDETSKMSAGVVELGFVGKADLCDLGIYILGEGGVIMGAGYCDLQLKGTALREFTPAYTNNMKKSFPATWANQQTSISIEKQSSFECLTGLEYKIEVGMEAEWYELDWKLYVGYEGILFYDVSSFIVPSIDGRFNVKTTNFGLAGLFSGVTLVF